MLIISRNQSFISVYQQVLILNIIINQIICLYDQLKRSVSISAFISQRGISPAFNSTFHG